MPTSTPTRQRRAAGANPIALALTAVAALTSACSGGTPARLTSKTPACATGIGAALQAFVREAGMPFTVADADPGTVLETGEITKQYMRDGSQMEIGLRVEKNEGTCVLAAFRRVTREPGSYSSVRGAFGSVTLDACTCE